MSALGKLGSSLTKAIRKLLKSPVVDEAVVKELIKDFQRALLQADVNVQLVLDLPKSALTQESRTSSCWLEYREAGNVSKETQRYH